jgi:hypothetical protein
MTYWPISSPSVFATSKHTPHDRTHVSHDGVEDDASNGTSQSQVEAETAVRDGRVKDEEQAPPQAQPASNSVIEDNIHGQVIAIRVTRSGHMFATLTRSTLTIWQTKAGLQFCATGLLLIRYVADRCAGLCLTLGAVGQDVWSQYRHSPAPRLPDFCSADNARLLDYLLPSDRSFFPRIPNTFCKHTWRPLQENQYHIRLQAAAPA